MSTMIALPNPSARGAAAISIGSAMLPTAAHSALKSRYIDHFAHVRKMVRMNHVISCLRYMGAHAYDSWLAPRPDAGKQRR